MNVLLFASAFLALASPAKAPVKVHVDAKNGDIITGEVTFKVTVDSQNLVTQVEFYVNDDLRDKATSTPYKFSLDSLNEPEGTVKLRFKAYTSEGETGEDSVSVKIYSGLDKGGDFHLQAGITALQDGKWDTAITEGRIALKADPKLNQARLVIARAYLRKGVMDKAQKFAEDAVTNDASNPNALDILSIINLQKAFSTYDRGAGDKNETLKSIGESLKNAVEARRKALDTRFDSVGAPTDKTLVADSDAALRSGRYGLAISILKLAFGQDESRTDFANRLAFAQIRVGAFNDALQTLENLKRNHGTFDTYTTATMAVLLAEKGDVVGSDNMIKDAIVSDGDNPIVTTAQAYIALKFVRTRLENVNTMSLNYDDLTGKDSARALDARNTLSQILKQLAKDQGQRTEVNYYLCALNNKLQNYETATHYFEAAVLAEPTNYDAYIEQGNKSIQVTMLGTITPEEKAFLYANARTMFTAALQARPASAAALTGLSLVATFEANPEAGIKWGKAAIAAEPEYAAGHIALSVASSLGAISLSGQATKLRDNNKNLTSNSERQANELKAREIESTGLKYTTLARTELRAAEKLDKKIEGAELSRAPAAWRYFNVGGRVPVLPAPSN